MTDTILVTGISGFIAKHVALALLNSGYGVRGSIRNEEKAAHVHATLKRAGGDVRRLSFVLADLTVDDGWDAAVKGCRYVQHIASPFPADQPKDREALVPIARDGAMRVLSAAVAAGVERVVVTSSIAAMMYKANRPATFQFSETDWSDPDWPGATSYIVSKTRAEQAVWDFMREKDAAEKLAVVNPGFVLGPSLDKEIGTSLGAIRMMLQGKYPALPPLAYPVVDVRDVARLHVKAMELKATAGHRLIAAAETLSFAEMAQVLKSGMGDAGKRVPTRQLPAWLSRFGARFDANLRTVKSDIGIRPVADTAYVTELTALNFKPAREAVLAAGNSLVEQGLV